MYAENKKKPRGQQHFRNVLDFSLKTQLSSVLPEWPQRNSLGQQDTTIKQLKYTSLLSLHVIQFWLYLGRGLRVFWGWVVSLFTQSLVLFMPVSCCQYNPSVCDEHDG